MSDIEELELLIQEKHRSEDLEEEIKHERRLLGQAEDEKRKIKRKILQDQLEKLKEKK